MTVYIVIVILAIALLVFFTTIFMNLEFSVSSGKGLRWFRDSIEACKKSQSKRT